MISLVKSVLSKRLVAEAGRFSPRGPHHYEIRKAFSSEGDSPRKRIDKFVEQCKHHPYVVVLVVYGITMWSLHRSSRKFIEEQALKRKKKKEKPDMFVYAFNTEGNNSFIKRHFYEWSRLVLLWDRITGNYNLWKEGSRRDPFDYKSIKEEAYESYRHHLRVEDAIAIAHEGGDLRLLKSPHDVEGNSLDEEVKSLHDMVTRLTTHPINQCLLDQVEISFRHIASSIESVNAQSLVETSGFDAVTGDWIPQRRVSKETVVIICLTAILAHSVVVSQIPTLLKFHVLTHLAAIYNIYEYSNNEIVSLIVKILANISVDRNSRRGIHNSGCLWILAKAARDSNIHISFPAQRALINLDREPDGDVLFNGIYQMYPVTRYNEKDIDCDIVFVHGLLGSAYKTWRREELSAVQQDRKAFLTSLIQERHTEMLRSAKKEDFFFEAHYNKQELLKKSNVPSRYHSQMIHLKEEELKEYCKNWPKEGVPLNANDFYPHEINGVVTEDTLCWPKDWLPLDCPNGRVINVDFESFISRLWPSCPLEQYEEGLKQRAQELMDKLVAAGVGKRPVVFVCHSMGGLLVKHIIIKSDSSSDEDTNAIAKNTKSVFFYSTPHYGSDYGRAIIDKGGRLLIPTKEFQEISGAQESLEELVALQEKFSAVYEKYNYNLVSLSESKPSQGGFGVELYLVPRHSSDMGHGENFSVLLDHLNICKPFCRRSFVYAKLVAHLQAIYPSGTPCPKVIPSLVLQKDTDWKKICERYGLGEYSIIDPHLIVGPVRGPKEVAEWERINRESEEHGYEEDGDPT